MSDTSGGGVGGNGQVDVLNVEVRTDANEQSLRQMEQQVQAAGENAGAQGGAGIKGGVGTALAALPALAAAAGVAVGAAIAGGLKVAVDVAGQARQGVVDIAASLGITQQEAAQLGEVAKRVFGSNWTGSLAEAQQAVVNVRKEVKGLTDEELQAVTEGTVAIAQKFEEEQPRIAAAVQAVMQATGQSAEQAMDFITKGFQRGLNSSGDFIDTLTEYSPQFEKAKISGGELFSLLETGAAKGALGTDKVADAFKEFGLTVVEVSDASSGVYAELGLSHQEIVKQINSGSLSQAQAFQLVSEKLKGVKGDADRVRIGTAIFGGAGEDMAAGMARLDVTKTKLEDLKGSTQQVKDATNTLGSVFETAWRQVQLQLQPVGDELLDLAQEAMPSVEGAIKQVGPVITSVVRFLVDGFREGKRVAGEFAPYFDQALGAIIPLVRSLGPLFGSVFGLVKTYWETVLKPAIGAILPFLLPILGGVADVVKSTVQTVTNIINAVAALLRGDWSKAWQFLVDAAWSAFGGLESALDNMATKLVAAGEKLGKKILDGLKTGVTGLQAMMLTALSSALDALAANAPAILRPLAEKLARAAHEAVDKVDPYRLKPGAFKNNGAINLTFADPAGGPPQSTAQGAQRFSLDFISNLADTFKRDPRVASDCAIIAYTILEQLGLKIKGTAVQNANVGVLEKNAVASGFTKVDGQEVKPGDLVVWTSGNGKTYGVVSGKHAGVVAGLDSKGNLKVIENPGTLKDGRDGITQVVGMYDRENATYYRAPTSPFAQPVTSTPKTGTPANVNPAPVTTPLPSAAELKEYNFTLADWNLHQKEALALARELAKAEAAHNTVWAQRVEERIRGYTKDSQARAGAVEFAKKVLADQASLQAEVDKGEEETELQRDQRLRREQQARAALEASIRNAGEARLNQIIRLGVTETNTLEKIGLAEAELERRGQLSAQAAATAAEARRKASETNRQEAERDAEAAGRQADQLVARSAASAQEAARLRSASLKVSRDDAVRAAGSDLEKVLEVQRAFAPRIEAAAKEEALGVLRARKAANQTWREEQEAVARASITDEGKLQARLKEIADSWRDENRNAYKAYYGTLRTISTEATQTTQQAEQRLREQDRTRREADARETAGAEGRAYSERVKATIESLPNMSKEGLLKVYDEARATRDQDLLRAVYGEWERRANSTAEAVSRLVDAEIAHVDARFRDVQAVTDNVYRMSYGAGEDGLLSVLSATTGYTVKQVAADVDAALAEAKRLSGTTGTLIERVWADALAARRASAAEEKRVNEAILASDVETSTARTQAIATLYQAEQDGADDAAITVEYLAGQIAELIALGRDPRKSGFTDWLDELIQKGGMAGEAAAQVKKELEGLIGLAEFRAGKDTSGVGISQTPDAPRRERPAPEVITPSSARPQAPAMTPSAPRVPALTPEQVAWQESIYRTDRVEEYRKSLEKLTLAQLEEAKATALQKGQQEQYDLIVAEIARQTKVNADTQAAAVAQGVQDAAATRAAQDQLADAHERLGEVMGMAVRGPYQDQITVLEKLRGVAGISKEDLEELIGTYTELNEKALRQQAVEQKINKWADYARRLIPVVQGAMQAVAGTSDEVAGQWASDLGSMVDDLVSFGTAIARGDWFGAAVQALTTIFGWWNRNKKAAEEAAQAAREYDEQFMFSENGYGTRTVEQYSTGFLFWQTDHYKATIDEAGKAWALALEQGSVNGIKDGFSQALAQNDFGLFGKSLTSNIGKAVLDGLVDGFLKGEAVAKLLGPAIQESLAAYASGDPTRIAAANARLKEAAAGVSKLAEQFYNDVLKPVAEEFGLLGAQVPKPGPATDTATPGRGGTALPDQASGAVSVPTAALSSITVSQSPVDLTPLTQLPVAFGQQIDRMGGVVDRFGRYVDAMPKQTGPATDWAPLNSL